MNVGHAEGRKKRREGWNRSGIQAFGNERKVGERRERERERKGEKTRRGGNGGGKERGMVKEERR